MVLHRPDWPPAGVAVCPGGRPVQPDGRRPQALPGSTRGQRLQVPLRRRRRRTASRGRPCRRCAGSARRISRPATAIVFFRSAADRHRRRHRHRQARSAAAHTRGSAGSATQIRPSAPPTHDRTTESSQGTRMSRSCISQPSARCESRSSASSSVKQIGSPPRLPGCHHQYGSASAVARQPEQQCVQRRVGQHDAEIRVVRRHRVGDPAQSRRRGSQHDRSLRARQQLEPMASSTSAMLVHAVGRSGTITANGLSPRRFRPSQFGDRLLRRRRRRPGGIRRCP